MRYPYSFLPETTKNVKNDLNEKADQSKYHTSGLLGALDDESAPESDISSQKSHRNVGSKLNPLVKHFSSKGLYNGLLGHTPNLEGAKQASITCCENKAFTKDEKGELVSYMITGPALTFSSYISKEQHLYLIDDVFEKLSEKFDAPTSSRQIQYNAKIPI